MTTFGTAQLDIDEVARKVQDAVGIAFTARSSSYIGDYYVADFGLNESI